MLPLVLVKPRHPLKRLLINSKKKKWTDFYTELFDPHTMETICSSVSERIVQLTLEIYKNILFFLTQPRNASSRTRGTAGSNQRGLVGFESLCECLKQVTFLSWALKCLGQTDTSEFNEQSNTDENLSTQIRFIQRKLSFLTDEINKTNM